MPLTWESWYSTKALAATSHELKKYPPKKTTKEKKKKNEKNGAG